MRDFLTNGLGQESLRKKVEPVLDDNTPDCWLVDPQTLRNKNGLVYLKDSKNIIKKMVEIGGIDSLQIGDKPSLEGQIKWIQSWL